MDNLFEQITNITKAHAYDIVSNQVSELKEQNEIFRKGLQDIFTIILEEKTSSVIDNPSVIIGKISHHVNDLLSNNRPL